MTLPKEDTNKLPKMDRSKGHFERSNWAVLLLFANFLTVITFLYYAYSFLEMIFINCQEMNLIELFKRSFSRLEWSGCPIFP